MISEAVGINQSKTSRDEAAFCAAYLHFPPTKQCACPQISYRSLSKFSSLSELVILVIMSPGQQPIENTIQPTLGGSDHPKTAYEILVPFLDACAANDRAAALQWAPIVQEDDLTWGLNLAVKNSSISKFDALTVINASRSFECVKWLVEAGYDVNTSILEGVVLLGMVVARNDEASIRYLLDRGADARLGPPLQYPGGPPMSIRAEANSYQMLNAAAAHCTPDIFTLLLSHGADVRCCTALHCAAGSYRGAKPDRVPSSSRILMLEYLLSLGLDVNALDDDIVQTHMSYHWGTPLHYAARRRNVEEARWLLDHGADPNKPTIFGITPRDMVNRLSPDHELVRLLSGVY
ncbi:ankyrin repeat-containing domain protein, partial [Paraphoma chrysanthemicola]